VGVAEKIITPNYEKLCLDILNSDEHVRFVGFVNDKSEILHRAQRNTADSLLSDQEMEWLFIILWNDGERHKILHFVLAKKD